MTVSAVPVLCSAGVPTTSRLAPRTSALHTSRPSPVQAGTPGTTSTHWGSVSSRSSVVAPVSGSTVRSCSSFWSRFSTTISGSWSASQTTVTRYSNAARSHWTGVRLPSRPTSSSETSAFGVPAAGYLISAGVRSGWAGSEMYQRCTGISSTRATSSARPSGAHQYPRSRPISSAAMCSARP